MAKRDVFHDKSINFKEYRASKETKVFYNDKYSFFIQFENLVNSIRSFELLLLNPPKIECLNIFSYFNFYNVFKNKMNEITVFMI